ncbi:MAG: hypothetical protein WC477_00585 [Patescibacteria group bacterium]
MSDISLLPGELRDEEKKEQSHFPSPISEAGLKMHVPAEMADEDIEIIEVDEGDLAAVLSDEPFMTRLTYQISLFFDQLKEKFFHKPEAAASAKVPPQFFKPPKPGLVTTPAAAGKPGEPAKAVVGATSKARIMPSTEVPRRVRVIRRIRKPVRISLASQEILEELSVDVSKRKWTMSVCLALFLALIGGGYVLLRQNLGVAQAHLAEVDGQMASTKRQVDVRLKDWSKYQDLEERLRILSHALDHHIISSRLFDFLERSTMPSVRYVSVAWADDGRLMLDVETDTYEHAAGQLLAMKQNPDVVSAEASSFASTRDEKLHKVTSVTFQLQLKLKASIMMGPAVQTDVVNASAATTTAQQNP